MPPLLRNCGLLLFFSCFVGRSVAIQDNGVLGDPVVDCGDNFIELRVETRDTFKGIMFVEGFIEDPSCRSLPQNDFAIVGRNATLRLKFQGCGVERRFSSQPKGVFVATQIIVAFHPEFLTKVDRVYNVQCFYMEMEKILEKELIVNMPPPTMQTENVPMPVCKYEVLDGSPEGPPIYYATVYHKWTCDSSTENTFCMTVHSCTVDDGNGERVELIDDKGCAQDKYLLQNLEYVSDLMVGKEAHVYKYADREQMNFDCQITLSIKEPETPYCPVPTCPDPPRRRRSGGKNETALTAVKAEKTEQSQEYIIPEEEIVRIGWLDRNFEFLGRDMCMSSVGLSVVAIFNAVLLSSSALLLFSGIRASRTKKL